MKQPLLLVAAMAAFTIAKSQTPGLWDSTATKRAKTFTTGAVGIGINAPRAWQEINYCPPPMAPQTGLMVTKFECMAASTPDPNTYGLDPNIFATPGGNEPFTVPFSFNIFPLTNTVTPLPPSPSLSSGNPLIWARTESFTGAGPNTFDTKFVVMPNGYTGINVTNPRAALDVRVVTGRNHPAAILGGIAPGTNSSASGLNTFKTQHIHFVPILNENGYNTIVKRDDAGLFFTDGKGADGANLNGTFVIAPWSINGDTSVGGLRMDKYGNLEAHGLVKARRVKVVTKWWSDFVFEANYKPMPLDSVEQYVRSAKHLPNIPSEQELKANGMDVADMQAKQMQNIEELYLHVIALQKQIKEQQMIIEELKKTVGK